jgi:hypothetical protein
MFRFPLRFPRPASRRCENRSMGRYFRFFGGVVVLIGTGGLRLLDSLQALDYFKGHAPGIYATVLSPPATFALICVAIALMAAGFWEIWKARKHPARESNQPVIRQDTPGAGSSATAVGTVTAGDHAKITIGSPIPAVAATTRERPLPEIVCLGAFPKLCNFTSADTGEPVPGPCVVVAFRNDVATQAGRAHDVVTHLNYLSDADVSIRVDEGWWSENEDHNVVGFSIDRARTKHLVIAVNAGGWIDDGSRCFALAKRYDRKWGCSMPTPVPLPEGRWRLTIHFTCEGFQGFYYSVGNVMKDGESSWSYPSTTQPPEWTAGHLC